MDRIFALFKSVRELRIFGLINEKILVPASTFLIEGTLITLFFNLISIFGLSNIVVRSFFDVVHFD